MENELLNKFKEYNTGGLVNEPISFSTQFDIATAATFLNHLSSSSGFGSLRVPKENTIELAVEHIVDTQLIRDNPVNAEIYIRKELARKLADKLIEEDLLNIQTNEDPALLVTKVRAKIKFIQE